jgi:hypothetical protein
MIKFMYSNDKAARNAELMWYKFNNPLSVLPEKYQIHSETSTPDMVDACTLSNVDIAVKPGMTNFDLTVIPAR